MILFLKYASIEINNLATFSFCDAHRTLACSNPKYLRIFAPMVCYQWSITLDVINEWIFIAFCKRDLNNCT